MVLLGIQPKDNKNKTIKFMKLDKRLKTYLQKK